MSADVVDLSSYAALLRDSLGKSQGNHDRLVSILGSFDTRLSALEGAMRPTQERTESLRKAHVNIDKTLKAADSVLAQFNVPRQLEDRIKAGPNQDLEGYLEAIEQLESCVAYFDANRSFRSAGDVLGHAQGLLKEATKSMEGTFKGLMESLTDAVDPSKLARKTEDKEAAEGEGQGDGEGQDEDGTGKGKGKDSTQKGLQVPTLVTEEAAAQIRDLADAFIAGNQEKLLFSMFKEVREAKLDVALKRIGVVKRSKAQMEAMEWKELETLIEGWRRQIQLSVKVVLKAERQLCEAILGGIEPQCSKVFSELGEHVMSILFFFGDAAAKTKKTPEKLAVLMDMYETMRDLMPEVNIVFSSQACTSLRLEAQGLLKQFASAAKEAWNNFENAVETEESEKMPQDGSTHGLTSYVVNYLKYLCEYQATLQELYKADNLGDASSRILTALQTNLDKKAKLYSNPALSQLFLMNNMHYVVHSIRKSELKGILGDDWIHRHRAVVLQHSKAYQQTSWNPVFSLLTAKGLSTGGKEDTVNKNLLKERFKAFNAAFEDLHRTQCLWKIPDTELRNAVQLQTAEYLIPAYRSFLDRYKPVLDSGGRFSRSEGSAKYIKFNEENLDSLLNEFFQGRPSQNVLVAASSGGRS